MAPRPTKRRVPAAGQLPLPMRVPRLVVGPMLLVDAGDVVGHCPTCERDDGTYTWRAGDPIWRFGPDHARI